MKSAKETPSKSVRESLSKRVPRKHRASTGPNGLGLVRFFPDTYLAAASSLLLLAGCVSAPTGPSVMSLPGSGKNFEQFRADDESCRQFAQIQSGGATADQAATNAGVNSAVVGTVVGAAAGAAMGGSEGAGVGAGTGLIVGTMAGSGAAQGSAYGVQRNYDNAYVQCMYAKGEQVPVSGVVSRRQVQTPTENAAPVAPSYSYPPPPPPPGNATPPAAPRQYWYYCANPAGYYPYIPECAGGWQKVPATAPPR